MTGTQRLLAALGVGLLSALAIVIFIAAIRDSDERGSNGTDAVASDTTRPKFVLFVGPRTLAMLAGQPEFRDTLSLIEVSDGADAAAWTAKDEVDGIILDAETVLRLPEPALPQLYASGRVIVVFEVELAMVQRLVASPSAYPGQSRPTSVAPTRGADGGSFFTTSYRSRPGGNGVARGTGVQDWNPRLFAAQLAAQARDVRLNGAPR